MTAVTAVTARTGCRASGYVAPPVRQARPGLRDPLARTARQDLRDLRDLRVPTARRESPDRRDRQGPPALRARMAWQDPSDQPDRQDPQEQTAQ
ncbi:hypothetical protein AB0G15_02785 [Streptosporangium sp. NPDC023825]|uniref:hypothetical protein n=1 Tax=Streptosporangium sp. NPDC023825 TaxID=3154909 RepID=UPI003447D9CE